MHCQYLISTKSTTKLRVQHNENVTCGSYGECEGRLYKEQLKPSFEDVF